MGFEQVTFLTPSSQRASKRTGPKLLRAQEAESQPVDRSVQFQRTFPNKKSPKQESPVLRTSGDFRPYKFVLFGINYAFFL